MHADYEDLFVIATVEDTDVSAVGEGLDAAPEIVMVEVLGGWLFERDDLAAGGEEDERGYEEEEAEPGGRDGW